MDLRSALVNKNRQLASREMGPNGLRAPLEGFVAFAAITCAKVPRQPHRNTNDKAQVSAF